MELGAATFAVTSLYSRNRVSGESAFTVGASPLRGDTTEKKSRLAAAPAATDSLELSDAASRAAALYPSPASLQPVPEQRPLPGAGAGASANTPDGKSTGSKNGKNASTSSSPSDAADNGEVAAEGKGEGEQTAAGGKQAAASGGSNAQGEPLTDEEKAQLDKLKARDREVRQHEQAHMAVGGSYAGSANYEYQQGPDGGRYAVGGEVSIDMSAEKDPKATAAKMRQVKAAALAPSQPSSQDLSVAAQASQMEAQAQAEAAKARMEGNGSDGGESASGQGNGDGADATGTNGASQQGGGANAAGTNGIPSEQSGSPNAAGTKGIPSEQGGSPNAPGMNGAAPQQGGEANAAGVNANANAAQGQTAPGQAASASSTDGTAAASPAQTTTNNASSATSVPQIPVPGQTDSSPVSFLGGAAAAPAGSAPGNIARLMRTYASTGIAMGRDIAVA